jgi:imidazole glycerol-phosphate synthase subunit HisF
MFRPRIIPVLLLRNLGLVKSIKFKDYRYIGDPINAVKIFNDLKADELVFLDILASKENRLIALEFVKNVGEEANMPFSVGGGIKTLEDIRLILSAGAEKVVLCSAAIENPDFVRQAADTFGSSTIVICIDVKKNFFGKNSVFLKGVSSTKWHPFDFAKKMAEMGAGELIIQSIDNDGTMEGYEINLIREISQTVKIPVIALGGAGCKEHLQEAYNEAYANGLAAGSLFVYHGPRKAVLINYFKKEEINQLFL